MGENKFPHMSGPTNRLEGSRLFFVAGEKSGDLHGGNLIKALKSIDSDIEIEAWGGDRMAAEGAKLKAHYEKMAFMGIWEVVKNLVSIFNNLKKCKEDIINFKPDAVVLIDYAGFNLKIAKFCKEKKIKVFYYISPKVWAWNTKRAYKIKKYVDNLFVIFPFEVDFFKKFDFEVDYVGNPLMDEIESFVPSANFHEKHDLSNKPIIAILAGSRQQEVKSMLPNMSKMAEYYPDYQFVISAVYNLNPAIYGDYGLPVIFNDTYNLLVNSDAALVTSGTATLETALLEIPQIICYSAGHISYQIFKLVIKIPYVSLVNLIAQKEIVKELIQYDFTIKNLKSELDLILINGKNREKQLENYKELKVKVGSKGASERTAELILKYLQK